MSLPPTAFTVLAAPRRREILQLVWDGELSAGEIAARLPVSFAAVSQHLGRLRAAGLVDCRRDGRRRLYRARRQELGPLAAWLEEIWAANLGELQRLAEEEVRDDREE